MPTTAPVTPAAGAAAKEEVADLGYRYCLPSCITAEYLDELEEGSYLQSKKDYD